MIFNNTQKLLAGALALVLVAGMTSPAFAGKPISCEITEGQTVNIQISLNEEVSVPKTFECSEGVIQKLVFGLRDCEALGLSFGFENPQPNGNVFSIDEVITNTSLGDETAHCEIEWIVFIIDSPLQIPLIQEVWLNEPQQQVGGELLPLDSSALMIAGLTSMSVWMVPAVAGLAGAGVYLVKFRKH